MAGLLLLAAAAALLRLLPWASAVDRSDFPASFLFGTATSSYQVSSQSLSSARRKVYVPLVLLAA
jgi:beta-glucosidase